MRTLLCLKKLQKHLRPAAKSFLFSLKWGLGVKGSKGLGFMVNRVRNICGRDFGVGSWVIDTLHDVVHWVHAGCHAGCKMCGLVH